MELVLPTRPLHAHYIRVDDIMDWVSAGYPAVYGYYYYTEFLNAMGIMDDAGSDGKVNFQLSTLRCIFLALD